MRKVALADYRLHECGRQFVSQNDAWAEFCMSDSDENQNQTPQDQEQACQNQYIQETMAAKTSTQRQMEGVALV